MVRQSGFTLVETIVVLAIMTILMVGLAAGLSNMQRSQRLGVSTERVLSTLHLARSLAISNNAVYFIRINNLPDTTQTPPVEEQFIAVHFFTPKEIRVPGELPREPLANEKHAWNSHGKFADTRVNLSGQPFTNIQVELQKLERNVWFGFDYGYDNGEAPAAGQTPRLIAFNPDGSATWGGVSTPVRLWVSDDLKLKKGMLETFDPEEWERLNKRDPHVRTIELKPAGLIRMGKPK